MRKMNRHFSILCTIILIFALTAPAYAAGTPEEGALVGAEDLIPAYDGTACVAVNDNVPEFRVGELKTEPEITFSELDELGRTGAGQACLGRETMPATSREPIGDVQPSGWQKARYEELIEDVYLYNRCHVIGYQLCGDSGSAENLFTGTSWLNSESMLYFENLVANYLEENPENHVLYRVTPLYEGEDLVARGVQMEGFSVEDFGRGVCFNVFCYNVQPGIEIDYRTGDSQADPAYRLGSVTGIAEVYESISIKTTALLPYSLAPVSEAAEKALSEQLLNGAAGTGADTDTDTAAEVTAGIAAGAVAETENEQSEPEPVAITYVLNTNTHKFHRPTCSSVDEMKQKNKQEVTWTREEVIAAGYEPCKRCKP